MTGSAKQSIEPQRKMDCFVATLLAMTVSPCVPARRPGESRDPYAVLSHFWRALRNLPSQQAPVVMGPCVRRDDARGFNCQTVEPSLRATGSRECAPDDRLREAIHRAATKDGLLRRYAPRNDGKPIRTRSSSLRKQGPIRRVLSFWARWPKPSLSLNTGGYSPCFRKDDERGFNCQTADATLCPLPSDNRGRGEYRVPLQRPPHPISTSVTIAKRPAFGMGRRRV